MIESVIEKCTEQVSNRFKLALLASQRAHDLNTGASNPTEMANLKGHKNTIISLCEIAERQVNPQMLFYLLVNRCREYVKGSTNDESNSMRLEKLLKFSDTDTQSEEIEEEIEEDEDEINIQVNDEEEIDDEDEE